MKVMAAVQHTGEPNIKSCVRNLYKYTKIYSGGEPELIEGDVFKTIVPLKGIGAIGSTGDNTDAGVAEKLPNGVAEYLPNRVAEYLPNELAEYLPNGLAESLTVAEATFLSGLLSFFDEREWITNAEAREATGKSDGSVKRFMRNLTNKGALEARGETRDRPYRLRCGDET